MNCGCKKITVLKKKNDKKYEYLAETKNRNYVQMTQ